MTGIRADYREGCLVTLPGAVGAFWEVRIYDADTGHLMLAEDTWGGVVHCDKRWFIRWHVSVSQAGREVFADSFDLRGREVLMKLAVGTIGDTLAWVSYVPGFVERHGCRAVVLVADYMAEILAPAWPSLTFVTQEQLTRQAWTDRAYAIYALMCFWGDDARRDSPVAIQMDGLHHAAGHILQMPRGDFPPLLHAPAGRRPIWGAYVCIAVQASQQQKYWNRPGGWSEVCDFLISRGLRVICIDRDASWGVEPDWNIKPPEAEDQTGNRPLSERINWLKHAEMFIGTSSGLSWLAWSVGCPVVLISGFTEPWNEFATPYRVINRAVCYGCWNDLRLQWTQDWTWCPRHHDDGRRHECSKAITSKQVIGAITQALKDGL